MEILKGIVVFLIVAAVIAGLAYMMHFIMPAIHAECRSGSPMSWAYRAEGLCIGADLEDR